MYRRLYFLFPSVEHVRSAIDDLKRANIRTSSISALVHDESQWRELSATTHTAKTDVGRWIEKLAWRANLLIFFIALIVFARSIFVGSYAWIYASAAMMLLSFAGGYWFSTKVPNVHFDEFRDALAHNEILLMIDVPKRRVPEIENLIHRNYPQAGIGGVGWTLASLRL